MKIKYLIEKEINKDQYFGLRKDGINYYLDLILIGKKYTNAYQIHKLSIKEINKKIEKKIKYKERVTAILTHIILQYVNSVNDGGFLEDN